MKLHLLWPMLCLGWAAQLLATENRWHFVEEGEVFLAREFIHVAIDADFSQIKTVCEKLREKTEDAELVRRVEGSTSTLAKRAYKLMITQVEHTCDLAFLEEHRPKRMIGGLVAASIFGLFGAVETILISGRVDKLGTRIDNTIIALKAQETRLSHQQQDLKNIHDSLQQLEVRLRTQDNEFVTRLHIMDLAMEVQALRHEVDLVQNGWKEVHAGRMPTEWLGNVHLADLFRRLKQRAKVFDGDIPLSHFMDLSQLPTSFVTINGGFRVLIHVPVVHERMRLLRYVPVPVSTPSGFKTIRSTEGTHIIVADKNRAHREVSVEDIARKCKVLGSVNVCSQLGYLRRGMSSSCLARLLVNADAESISNACEVADVNQHTEGVYQTDHNNFTLFSTRRASWTNRCNGTTKDNIYQAGLNDVVLGAGCEMFAETLELCGSTDAEMRVEVVREAMWTVEGDEPLKQQQNDRSIVPDLISVNDTDETGASLREDGGTNHWFWLAVGTAVLLVLMMLACFALMVLAVRRATKRETRVEAETHAV